MPSLLSLLRPDASCHDLLGCLFELNPAETRLYLTLVREGAQRLDALATLVQRERSTVHRGLAKLVSLGLVTKASETIPGGGYFHRYTALAPAHLKRRVEARLAEFQGRMAALLTDFEAHIATAALTLEA